LSLKGFHILFIIFAIISAVFFGIWGIQYSSSIQSTGYLIAGIGSLITAVALVIYLILFIKKLKKI
jgi:hypothetical protein